MANPQPTDVHLRVAHSINEAMMLRDFTKRQRKVLDLILRLSWGCGKKTAYIPRQRDFEVIGIRETHISTELSWLVESKVITINGAEYAFNKDFDVWQVSRVKPYAPQKLTELVKFNLDHTYQNGKFLAKRLTKTVSKNLPKEEVSTNQKSKSPKANLATPKESKRKLKKENKEIDHNTNNEVPDFARRLGYSAADLPTLEEAEYLLNRGNLLARNRQRLKKLVVGYKYG